MAATTETTTETRTYRIWQHLSRYPGGRLVFSAAAAVRVPFFATVLPHIVRMEPGYAEVSIRKWPLTYNHLRTVHAIAMCNAAEVAMGMLMEATVPTTHRWIPKAMEVQYLHKATTALRACARIDPPDFDGITDGADVLVGVSVYDRFGTEVVRAAITTWVTRSHSS
ncbi:hotdog fold domain-containing protein [Mycolicibacterium anyangense]|nr:hotdog fold domain-containing protein [Mycolicibacterium anyangense]